MRLAGYFALAAFLLRLALYAITVYGFLPLGAAVHPDIRATFEAERAGIYVHVFAASVARAR